MTDGLNREKMITWEDPKTSSRQTDSMAGLEYLQGILNGRISPPPVAMLIGYRIQDVSEGHVVFEIMPEECHYNPFGTVHGGIISTLLDTAMTASVLSTLPRGRSCSTVEIKLNFVRPVSIKNGVLRCDAEPIHLGRRLATAQGRITDSKGNLCAHGINTCSIFQTDKIVNR
ncbi:MAG: PaaI family thioesterase [Desulfobacteraceae bacterium]|nr:PaaI family thioesterase [Desulfobacteraceae bacterium]